VSLVTRNALAEPSGSPHYTGQRRHTSPAMDLLRLLLARRYLQQGRSIPSTLGVFRVHSTFFVPGDLDLWPLTLTFKVRVNLAEIRSAVPAIHCRMRVPRRKTCRRFRPISRLKLVAMAMSLDQSGNQYQIEHLQECVYHAWEFGEDRSCSFRDLCSKRSLKKRKESNSGIT